MSIHETLGADLRSLRKNRQLTLEAVASKLGKSVGWLSQVERGLSHPDARDLTTFAKLYRVPKSLFSPGKEVPREAGRIVRTESRRAIGERMPGLIEELLSPDLTDDFEVVHSTFLPGSERRIAANRPTQELAVMLSGKLDIWLGDEAFTVATGDSFRIRDEGLCWANPYDQPAIAVWVIAPPVY